MFLVLNLVYFVVQSGCNHKAHKGIHEVHKGLTRNRYILRPEATGLQEESKIGTTTVSPAPTIYFCNLHPLNENVWNTEN